MTFRGHVKNGVVVLDDKASLPEGAEVRVETVASNTKEPTWAQVFRDLVGKANGLPNDLAQNHDHYLHGAPKR